MNKKSKSKALSKRVAYICPRTRAKSARIVAITMLSMTISTTTCEIEAKTLLSNLQRVINL